MDRECSDTVALGTSLASASSKIGSQLYSNSSTFTTKIRPNFCLHRSICTVANFYNAILYTICSDSYHVATSDDISDRQEYICNSYNFF